MRQNAERISVSCVAKKVLTSTAHRRLVLVAGEELLQCLEGAPNILLGHLRQGVDLAERARHPVLPARNENAPGDDSFLGLAFERLCVVDHLEEVLGRIGARLGQADGVAVRANLLVRRHEVLGALVMRCLVLRALQVATATRAIAKRNRGGELRPVQQRVRAISHTRRVIVALVIVCKRTPLGARVDDAIAQHEAARAADHVARGKLFNQVGRVLLALLADHLHVEVLNIRIHLRFGNCCVRHLVFSVATYGSRLIQLESLFEAMAANS